MKHRKMSVRNATQQAALSIRKDLTEYSFGVISDAAALVAYLKRLSPVVPTGTTSGRYNKFDTTQAFVDYRKTARRAVGGQANTIGFLSDAATFNADPFGLRVSIDKHERTQVGDIASAVTLLEQSKSRTLTVNCLTAQAMEIITKVKASVSATAKLGAWKKADADPIAEINSQIRAVWKATGMVPNKIDIDFGAWCVMVDHPKVRGLMSTTNKAVTVDSVRPLLVNPAIDIMIVDNGVLTGGGLANTSATVQGILGGSILVYYSSTMATQYDPSAFKTFSPSANLFTNVYTYREEPHLDWYENDWTCDNQVVSALLARRIDVEGAND